MKKFIYLFAILLFLIPSIVNGGPSYFNATISKTDRLWIGSEIIVDDETGVTDIRTVTIDGSAASWTDNVNLSNFIGCRIVFTDSAGKKLWGYIEEADTAEHYE